MRDLPNIERSGFHAGYVGYATYQGEAVVYRIVRKGRGWFAHAPNHKAPQLHQPTLLQMSDSLSDLALTPLGA